MNSHPSFDQIIDILLQHFAAVEAQAMQESELSDLSMKQLVYLETIASLGTPSFSDLARRLEVSKPSVTAIISKLIQKGYVEKVQSMADKRLFSILLTEKGQALHELHSTLHRKIARHFAAALDETELLQLGQLLQKVVITPERNPQ